MRASPASAIRTRGAGKSSCRNFERFIRAAACLPRRLGRAALCYVAAGRLLGYMEPHINSWDCLGAIAVIEAAGLKTSDFLANDGLRKGNWLIAGNDAVYAELEDIYLG